MEGSFPFPRTDTDYIWHSTSHNPKTTAKISSYLPYLVMNYGPLLPAFLNLVTVIIFCEDNKSYGSSLCMFS